MPVKVSRGIILPGTQDGVVEVTLKNGTLIYSDIGFNWDAIQDPIEKIEVKVPGTTITLQDENYFMFKDVLMKLDTGDIIEFTLNFGCFSGTDLFPIGFSVDSRLRIERKRFDLSRIHKQAFGTIVKQ